MKKVLVLAFLLSVAAFAVPLDFNSLGTLSCGPGNPPGCSGGGGSLVFENNGATLTLTYIANQESGLEVPVAPGYVVNNFGTLMLSCAVCDGLTATFNLSGATLSLGIEQVNGSPFNAINGSMFTGTLAGSLTVTGGTVFGGSALIAFSPLQGSLSDGTTITYYLQQPDSTGPMPAGYGLSINNATTIQGAMDAGELTSQAVPEPMSFLLGGFGLLAIGTFRRKARKNQEEAQA